MMKKWILLTAITVALVSGCKKKESNTNTPPPTGSAGSNAVTNAGSGSAAGAGSGSAVAAVTPMSPEQRAKRFEECWGFINADKYDDYKTCFADDAVLEMPGLAPDIKGAGPIVDDHKNVKTAFPDQKSEAQLVLANGKDVVGVMLMTGTHSGPMGDMKPTNKKFGILLAHAFTFDDTNKVVREWEFFDMATVLSQLGHSKDPARPAIEKGSEKVVVVAKDDAAEKENLAAFQRMIDAFGKHDAKAFGDSVTDDVVWSEASMPKDLDKKELVAGAETMWKAFSDGKFTVSKSWAAGDYVVAYQNFEGTNDGAAPSMGIKKATGKKVVVPELAVYKFTGGKVQTGWVFFQNMGLMGQLAPTPAPAPDAGSATGSAAGSATK